MSSCLCPYSMTMSSCAYRDLYHGPCLCSYAYFRCLNFCVYHCVPYPLTMKICVPCRDPCPCFCASNCCCWNAYPWSCLSSYAYRRSMKSSCDLCCSRTCVHFGLYRDPCFCVTTCYLMMSCASLHYSFGRLALCR
jgi:hypothetical protein